MTRLLATAAAAALCASVLRAAVAGGGAPGELVRRDVYLMGTRVALAIDAADRATGLAALDTALVVLEQVESELSTWRAESAISRLNRAAPGEPWRAEGAVCGLFRELYTWHAGTAGAFDPAVGALTAAWDIHGKGAIPSDERLRQARARTGLQLFAFDSNQCTVVRRAEATIDVGAFGKGEALDRAAARLGAGPWLIDLGGQVMVGGSLPEGAPWPVDLAHPLERTRVVMQIGLRSGSVSTSAGSERDLSVEGRRVGHILDPRTGRPALFSGSVVVWHERALVADLLSTALYVMGPEAGSAWAQERGIAAAFLIPDGDGVRVEATPLFRKNFGQV
jgi:FAD:protein FMN transferase